MCLNCPNSNLGTTVSIILKIIRMPEAAETSKASLIIIAAWDGEKTKTVVFIVPKPDSSNLTGHSYPPVGDFYTPVSWRKARRPSPVKLADGLVDFAINFSIDLTVGLFEHFACQTDEPGVAVLVGGVMKIDSTNGRFCR